MEWTWLQGVFNSAEPHVCFKHIFLHDGKTWVLWRCVENSIKYSRYQSFYCDMVFEKCIFNVQIQIQSSTCVFWDTLQPYLWCTPPSCSQDRKPRILFFSIVGRAMDSLSWVLPFQRRKVYTSLTCGDLSKSVRCLGLICEISPILTAFLLRFSLITSHHIPPMSVLKLDPIFWQGKQLSSFSSNLPTLSPF